ncbi:MAG: phasin family protein [Burkholderiales bacterium]
MSLDMNNTMLLNAQRLRRCQLEHIEAALTASSKVNNQLGSAKDQQQWQTICSEQLRGNNECAAAYWNSVTHVLGQNQNEFATACATQIQALFNDMKQPHSGPTVMPETITNALRMMTDLSMAALRYGPPHDAEDLESTPNLHNGHDKPAKRRNHGVHA